MLFVSEHELKFYNLETSLFCVMVNLSEFVANTIITVVVDTVLVQMYIELRYIIYYHIFKTLFAVITESLHMR